MAVTPSFIIEELNVIEQTGPGFITGFVDVPSNPFLFKPTEKEIYHGIRQNHDPFRIDDHNVVLTVSNLRQAFPLP
jgi:hypothetical protein